VGGPNSNEWTYAVVLEVYTHFVQYTDLYVDEDSRKVLHKQLQCTLSEESRKTR
jgi:hypothetical protein